MCVCERERERVCVCLSTLNRRTQSNKFLAAEADALERVWLCE
jgi:hypothetical protein